MKILLSALMILSASFASAELKVDGTFVPSTCSTEGRFNVCFGKKAGQRGQFLSIGQSLQNLPAHKVYAITERKPANGGINPSSRAENITFVDEAGNEGRATVRYHKQVGQVTTSSINGVLPNGKPFAAGVFVNVMVTL